jgi:hypothetical protein
MRTFLSILLLAFAIQAQAASIITATITVTNVPSAGNTITVNSDTRTNVSAVVLASKDILIGASIGASATNVFRQFANYPFTTLTLGFGSSNIIYLSGIVDQSLSVSVSGTWATVSTSPNTVTNMVTVRVPGAAHPTQSAATNMFSVLASDLSTYSTNSIGSTATILANYVNKTTAQTVSTKTFSDSILRTTEINGNSLSNNRIYFSMTNAGTRFFEPGNTASVWALGAGSNGFPSVWGVLYGADGTNFGFASPQTNITSTPENLLTYYDGDNRYARKSSMVNLSTLSTGNNAGVDAGTAINIRIASGPGGAFTINGITGGFAGRPVTFFNRTGFNMTFANDSGVDPVATNRIYTLTGADISTTGDGAVKVVYSISDLRWLVESIRD